MVSGCVIAIAIMFVLIVLNIFLIYQPLLALNGEIDTTFDNTNDKLNNTVDRVNALLVGLEQIFGL